MDLLRIFLSALMCECMILVAGLLSLTWLLCWGALMTTWSRGLRSLNIGYTSPIGGQFFKIHFTLPKHHLTILIDFWGQITFLSRDMLQFYFCIYNKIMKIRCINRLQGDLKWPGLPEDRPLYDNYVAELYNKYNRLLYSRIPFSFLSEFYQGIGLPGHPEGISFLNPSSVTETPPDNIKLHLSSDY